jgi:hypothetical protein
MTPMLGVIDPWSLKTWLIFWHLRKLWFINNIKTCLRNKVCLKNIQALISHDHGQDFRFWFILSMSNVFKSLHYGVKFLHKYSICVIFMVCVYYWLKLCCYVGIEIPFNILMLGISLLHTYHNFVRWNGKTLLMSLWSLVRVQLSLGCWL